MPCFPAPDSPRHAPEPWGTLREAVPRSAAASLSALQHQLSVITVMDVGRMRHTNNQSPFCKGRATKPALGLLASKQHPLITSCLPLTVGNFAAAATRTAVKKNWGFVVLWFGGLVFFGFFFNYLGKAEASLDSSNPTSRLLGSSAILSELYRRTLQNLILKIQN